MKEVSPLKKNLLLINKADLLTAEQREAWSSFLTKQGLDFAFFSALEEEEVEAAVEEEEGEAAGKIESLDQFKQQVGWVISSNATWSRPALSPFKQNDLWSLVPRAG